MRREWSESRKQNKKVTLHRDHSHANKAALSIILSSFRSISRSCPLAIASSRLPQDFQIKRGKKKRKEHKNNRRFERERDNTSRWVSCPWLVRPYREVFLDDLHGRVRDMFCLADELFHSSGVGGGGSSSIEGGMSLWGGLYETSRVAALLARGTTTLNRILEASRELLRRGVVFSGKVCSRGMVSPPRPRISIDKAVKRRERERARKEESVRRRDIERRGFESSGVGGSARGWVAQQLLASNQQRCKIWTSADRVGEDFRGRSLQAPRTLAPSFPRSRPSCIPLAALSLSLYFPPSLAAFSFSPISRIRTLL